MAVAAAARSPSDIPARRWGRSENTTAVATTRKLDGESGRVRGGDELTGETTRSAHATHGSATKEAADARHTDGHGHSHTDDWRLATDDVHCTRRRSVELERRRRWSPKPVPRERQPTRTHGRGAARRKGVARQSNGWRRAGGAVRILPAATPFAAPELAGGDAACCAVDGPETRSRHTGHDWPARRAGRRVYLRRKRGGSPRIGNGKVPPRSETGQRNGCRVRRDVDERAER